MVGDVLSDQGIWVVEMGAGGEGGGSGSGRRVVNGRSSGNGEIGLHKMNGGEWWVCDKMLPWRQDWQACYVGGVD